MVNDLKRALEHEWFVTYIDREKFDIEFLLINSRGTPMSDFLLANQVVTHHMDFNGKASIPLLLIRMWWFFMRSKFDVVHTHLFISSLIALPAAFLAGIKTRIMTRHHSDYHHVWFPSAVKFDRFTNWFATRIVAISSNVKNILVEREGVPADNVELVYHGIDFSQYKPLDKNSERVINIKSKYQIAPFQPVVGVVSRFTEWKGIQYIIPAFLNLLKEKPDAVLVLANASGDYEDEIENLLMTLPANSYRKIKFETDITALFCAFDVFVHVPVSASAEAFGQIYIEALALRIPSVFTASGILAEFGQDGVNCIIVPFRQPQAIYAGINEVLNHSERIAEMVNAGYLDVTNKFSFDFKIKKLMNLYH